MMNILRASLLIRFLPSVPKNQLVLNGAPQLGPVIQDPKAPRPQKKQMPAQFRAYPLCKNHFQQISKRCQTN